MSSSAFLSPVSPESWDAIFCLTGRLVTASTRSGLFCRPLTLLFCKAKLECCYGKEMASSQTVCGL